MRRAVVLRVEEVFAGRDEAARALAVGDIVERYLRRRLEREGAEE